MSNSEELRTVNIVHVSADRQLKIDCSKSSPCDMKIFHCCQTAKIDIETLNDFLCIFHRSSVCSFNVNWMRFFLCDDTLLKLGGPHASKPIFML